MKKKRKIFFIVIVAVVLAIAAVYINFRKENQFVYVEKWELKYDVDSHLISAENLSVKTGQVNYGMYYKYDKQGNRTEYRHEDHVYDDNNFTNVYKYENNRLSESVQGSMAYTYSYENPGYIFAEKSGGNGAGYRFELGEDQKIRSVTYIQSESYSDYDNLTCYEAEWNQDARIASAVWNYYGDFLTESSDSFRYNYHYDDKGRYKKIICQAERYLSEKKTKTIAEFSYALFSDDCTAYIYQENELIGKCVYQYDKNGNLTEVGIYRVKDRKTLWDWGYSEEIIYPGQELLDNLSDW